MLLTKIKQPFLWIIALIKAIKRNYEINQYVKNRDTDFALSKMIRKAKLTDKELREMGL